MVAAFMRAVFLFGFDIYTSQYTDSYILFKDFPLLLIVLGLNAQYWETKNLLIFFETQKTRQRRDIKQNYTRKLRVAIAVIVGIYVALYLLCVFLIKFNRLTSYTVLLGFIVFALLLTWQCRKMYVKYQSSKGENDMLKTVVEKEKLIPHIAYRLAGTLSFKKNSIISHL